MGRRVTGDARSRQRQQSCHASSRRATRASVSPPAPTTSHPPATSSRSTATSRRSPKRRLRDLRLTDPVVGRRAGRHGHHRDRLLVVSPAGGAALGRAARYADRPSGAVPRRGAVLPVGVRSFPAAGGKRRAHRADSRRRLAQHAHRRAEAGRASACDSTSCSVRSYRRGANVPSNIYAIGESWSVRRPERCSRGSAQQLVEGWRRCENAIAADACRASCWSRTAATPVRLPSRRRPAVNRGRRRDCRGSARPEVMALSAVSPRRSTSIDLHVSAVSEDTPFAASAAHSRERARRRTPDARADRGRIADRRVRHVSPDPSSRPLQRGIAAADDEAIVENNSRSSCQPGGAEATLLAWWRARYEFTFSPVRSPASPGLEVDSIVRKGRTRADNTRSSSRPAGPRGRP